MSNNSPYYYDQSNDDYELDGENIDDYYTDPCGNNKYMNDQNREDSDEDTDEASEVDENAFSGKHKNYDQPIEIKEQMYLVKLTSLQKQLEDVENRTHPEYIRRIKKLEYQREDRKRVNEIYREHLLESANRDYMQEKIAATKEFEEKRADLKVNLISDFEDKRKLIETERHNMELSGDSMEVKSTVTRKLRRRPNEPVPVMAEKRRKAPSGQLVILLEEKEIENDLKTINRGKTMQIPQQQTNQSIRNATNSTNGLTNSHTSPPPESYPLVETKIEDNKLLYERRWYHRGQSVFIEGKDIGKFAGTISAIGNDSICVKKLNESKTKIPISQLVRGRVIIKRRAN